MWPISAGPLPMSPELMSAGKLTTLVMANTKNPQMGRVATCLKMCFFSTSPCRYAHLILSQLLSESRTKRCWFFPIRLDLRCRINDLRKPGVRHPRFFRVLGQVASRPAEHWSKLHPFQIVEDGWYPLDGIHHSFMKEIHEEVSNYSHVWDFSHMKVYKTHSKHHNLLHWQLTMMTYTHRFALSQLPKVLSWIWIRLSWQFLPQHHVPGSPTVWFDPLPLWSCAFPKDIGIFFKSKRHHHKKRKLKKNSLVFF